MTIIDAYIFHILVFSPLIASLFITLIPATDMHSKMALSKFFSTLGFLAAVRIFIIFFAHKTVPETTLTLNFTNFNINLNLVLTKYNIFLYGTTATFLLFNTICYKINDTKNNIHQVAPFVLIFLLYVSFGKNDPRVALPILSITNFLIYFMIGYGEKIRRGSTIFHMGIFLFSCDALALILLQIHYLGNNEFFIGLENIVLLLPGMVRLCLPLVTPFMKKLVLNIDDLEGPFIIIFQQLSGLFIIIIIRQELTNISIFLPVTIASLALIGALYIALMAVNDFKKRTLPYYFLIFYSSLTTTILFIFNDDRLWSLAICLFMTSIACFFNAARFTQIMGTYRFLKSNQPQLRSLWFINMALFLGIPGLGTGTALWASAYSCATAGIFNNNYPFGNFFRSILIGWIIAFILIAYALLRSVNESITQRTFDSGLNISFIPLKELNLWSSFLTIFLTLALPFLTLYGFNQGL